MPTAIAEFGEALRVHAGDFSVRLDDEAGTRLERYYEVLLKWNPRLHLVAPCSPAEFATRHVLESLLLLPHLSEGAGVCDVGSGAGLPIIPCLIVRPDLRATLIESSPKKTVFLQEVLRETGCTAQAQVIATRFEKTAAPDVEFVTCRALDHFAELLPALIDWSPPASTLLLFAGDALREKVERLLPGARVELIPGSERRFLILAPRLPPD
jgi:16S rRNA (guanine527-N7)-methyltransferase